jgi:hypothetical protein
MIMCIDRSMKIVAMSYKRRDYTSNPFPLHIRCIAKQHRNVAPTLEYKALI